MKIRNKIFLALVAFQMWFATSAFANNNADPFKSATEKSTKLTELLTGPFAVAFFGLIITGAGIAWAMDYLSKKWAINIAGGATLAGAGVYFAQFFFA